MKIHRFIGDFDLNLKQTEINDKEIVNQIKKVLRLKEGETIELSNGKNLNARAMIKKINKNHISVKIEKTWETTNQIKNNVTLYCAVLKKENFEIVVQKTTECGVSKIIPIITDRTIKTGINIERLKKIAKEAAEQSGRSNIPEISEPEKFNPGKSNSQNILFDSNGKLFWSEGLSYKIPWEARRSRTEKIPSKEFSCILEDNPSCNVFIGPEGGWTQEELEKAKNANFTITSLGPLTLRGETAAIIASYLVVNL